MSKIPLLLLCTLVIAGCANDQSAEIERLRAEIAELRAATPAPLPASLHNLFPPNSEVPVWQMQMHAMVMPLMSGVASTQEGDMEKAAAHFAEFRKQYVGTSTMVPEWTDRFDVTKVDALDEAVASGDPEAVMAALGGVAETCHSCHYENMVTVQQLFHWPKFADVRVDHPERGELTLPEVMQGVEMPMIGVGVALQEGEPEKARARFQAFEQAFSLLEEACESCHETERTYFVDETVDRLIERLGTEVAKPAPDPAAAGRLLQLIGEEACFKCHLVHVPAAFTQKKAALAAAAVGSH